MTELALFIAGGAVFLSLRAISDHVDRRLHELERQSLDSTVRWAYARGWVDGKAGHEHGQGAELAVVEFRDKFGVERREVRK